MPFLVWARRIVTVCLVLSAILLVVGLVGVGVLPAKYLLPAVIALVVVVVALVVAIVSTRARTQRVRLGILLVVALAVSGLNVVGYVMLRQADSVFGSIQSSDTAYVEYSIVALKDNDVRVETAATVGVIQDDPLFDRSSEALTHETPARQQAAATLGNLVESLRTGEVELGAMRTASLGLLRDNYPEFHSQTAVLATYRVRGDTQATAQVDVTKPFAIYISGIDTYGEVSTVSRSDVNILAAINPGQHSVLLVNTPRDYYVQLHGTTGTRDKLTHAGVYGVDMSRQTVEDLYGVSIPYYLRINFSSLVKVVDTIGPIEVQSDYAFKDFRQGSNTLDSKRALEFARERYSFQEGDRQRGRNQQRVIEAIIAKLSKPQNAVHLNAILASVEDSAETNMSEESLRLLTRMQLDDSRQWKVTSIDVDGVGDTQPTYSMGAQPLYVMQPDERSLNTARQQIVNFLAE